jgi:pimeloyl-ACP methyl ester carboxylesterase
VIAAILLAMVPVAFVLGGAAALTFPNPSTSRVTYGTPEQFGLVATNVTVKGTPAWWFPNADADMAVLVCHGRSRNRSWMLPLIARLSPNYSVLAIEFPHHGLDDWGRSSVGFREAADVHHALDFLSVRGQDRVAIYGVSMGGAAAIFALSGKHHDSVLGIVTDGTYAHLGEVAAYGAERYKLPKVLVGPTLTVAGWMNNMRYNEVRPEIAARHLEVPLLAIHGDKDPLIPSSSATRIASSMGELGQSFVYPGGHDDPSDPLVGELVETFFRQLASE